MTISIRFRPALLRGLILLSLAGTAAAVAPPADDTKARVAAGKNRFDALCVSCHGAAGTGVAASGGGASYGPRLAGRAELDPSLIRERIVHGKHGDKAMPPWGTVLDDEAVEQLVSYVRLLAATAPQAAAHLTLAPFDLADAARVDAGRRRFAKTCAGYCHGHEGSGGRAPDFKGRDDLPPEVAFETISKGRQGAEVMPPWGAAFTPEQIWELVAYLKHLGQQQP